MQRPPLSQVKIVATLGPASAREEVLLAMFQEGVDVCRLNLSHGTHQEHKETIDKIRLLAKEHHYAISILADLQGPKLRIGELSNAAVLLKEGDLIAFVSTPCLGTEKQVYMSYTDFPKTVKIGDKILIDDGNIKLEVIATDGVNKVDAKVIYGGILRSKKGVNLPNTRVNLPCLTEKDLVDAEFALDMEVDWLGLSFVRHVEDVKSLKNLVDAKGMHDKTRVLAKIEKPEALDTIEAIIEASDGIMVARGDLGVEVSFEKVPLIQKHIIDLCVRKARPVIVATQMLESMVHHFVPTRAEANDVANAVLDGADAVMLSGETSMGDFPVESVKAMQNIIDFTESHGKRFKCKQKPQIEEEHFLSDSICYTASKMAMDTEAKAIIIFTDLRKPVMRLASFRPYTKILVYTNNPSLPHALSFVWGTEVFLMPVVDKTIEAVAYANAHAVENALLKEGDTVLYVGHIPIDKKSAMNSIRLSKVSI